MWTCEMRLRGMVMDRRGTVRRSRKGMITVAGSRFASCLGGA